MLMLRVRPVVVVVASIAAACGGSSSDQRQSAPSAAAAPAAARGPVATDKSAYPVFPNADAGADPSVPADQGCKGFTGQGWETNIDFDLIGDPHAVKGGMVRDWMLSFPGTLRMAGPEWNTSVNYTISQLVYEQLLQLHPPLALGRVHQTLAVDGEQIERNERRGGRLGELCDAGRRRVQPHLQAAEIETMLGGHHDFTVHDSAARELLEKHRV